jgi:hypothetical protein
MHQKTRIAGHSHRGDRFDLQQEIRIGEPAQNAQRAGRRRAGEISKARLADLGGSVLPLSPADYGKLNAAEVEK